MTSLPHWDKERVCDSDGGLRSEGVGNSLGDVMLD